MIKVLNVLSDSNIGGAGRLLVNYLRNFDRTKFDVAVVLPKNSDLKPCVEETVSLSLKSKTDGTRALT